MHRVPSSVLRSPGTAQLHPSSGPSAGSRQGITARLSRAGSTSQVTQEALAGLRDSGLSNSLAVGQGPPSTPC